MHRVNKCNAFARKQESVSAELGDGFAKIEITSNTADLDDKEITAPVDEAKPSTSNSFTAFDSTDTAFAAFEAAPKVDTAPVEVDSANNEGVSPKDAAPEDDVECSTPAPAPFQSDFDDDDDWGDFDAGDGGAQEFQASVPISADSWGAPEKSIEIAEVEGVATLSGDAGPLDKSLERLLTILAPSGAATRVNWRSAFAKENKTFDDDDDVFVWDQSALRKGFLEHISTLVPEGTVVSPKGSPREPFSLDRVTSVASQFSETEATAFTATSQVISSERQPQSVELKPKSKPNLKGVSARFKSLVSSLPDLSHLLK